MDRPIAVVCPHCQKPATAVPKGSAEWSGHDEHGDVVAPPTEWTLVQCDNCGQPSVHARENFGYGFQPFANPPVLYPASRQLNPLVPELLRREWSEAKKCFDATAYSACVVMVRRTLEGTCQDQGVGRSKTLAQGLRELEGRKLIDSMLLEWANTLRIAGNKGAHFTGSPVSRDDAADTLAFGEALLDHLYVLRHRFELFKQRVNK